MKKFVTENTDCAVAAAEILDRELARSRYAKDDRSYKGAGYSVIVYIFWEWVSGEHAETRPSDAYLKRLCEYGARRHGLLKGLYKQMETQIRCAETEPTHDTAALVRDAVIGFCERKSVIKHSDHTRAVRRGAK